MEIREMKIREVGLFVKFFNNSVNTQFPEYSKKAKELLLKKEWTDKGVESSFRDKTIFYFLALEEKKIIGYLIGTAPFAGVSSIYWLAVNKEYQGRGIGKKLVNKFISFLKKKGAHKINLSITNRKNIPFYEKLGFENIHFVKKDYFGLDTYWMYKDIQNPQW